MELQPTVISMGQPCGHGKLFLSHAELVNFYLRAGV
jgi:hypothetical protein